ncbi:MAG: nitroreductase family protein [Actinomycetota bacterium]
MDFTELVQARRSVRTFSDKEVSEKIIKQVVECARLAPSWKNQQCWHFIVIRDKERIAELVSDGMVLGNSWLKKAPVLIVACGDPARSGQRGGVPYYAVDVAIAMQHLVLGATELGLGTCWIGVFDEPKLIGALDIPKNMKIVGLTPLGYPADNMSVRERLTKTAVGSKRRKPLAEILHYENW